MSMEINGSYNRAVNDYAKRVEEEKPLDRLTKKRK